MQDELIAEVGGFKGEIKREIEQLRDSHETILCGLASAFEPRGEVCAAAAAPALTPGVAVNTGAPSVGTVARVAGARRRAGEERGAAVPARKAGAAGKVGDSATTPSAPAPPRRPSNLLLLGPRFSSSALRAPRCTQAVMKGAEAAPDEKTDSPKNPPDTSKVEPSPPEPPATPCGLLPPPHFVRA